MGFQLMSAFNRMTNQDQKKYSNLDIVNNNYFLSFLLRWPEFNSGSSECQILNRISI